MTKRRYLVYSIVKPIHLTLPVKSDAIAAARGLSEADKSPVFIFDRMARRGCENRWRVAPYCDLVKPMSRRE